MESFSTIVENNKNINQKIVLDTTFDLIVEKGIQQITFNEIAKKSNIGVATIYRYFSNKTNLISNCAIYKLSLIIEDIQSFIENIDFCEKKAIDEFSSLLNCFAIYFRDNKKFLKFLSEFDNYLSFNKMEKVIEEKYNELFKSFYLIALNIYKKGLKDKSFTKLENFESFYFTIATSLLQTCIKGTVSPSLIPLDSIVSTESKINTLIKMAIHYCKRS